MISTKASTSAAPIRTGTPNSICNAIAPPSSSANDVETEASMAVSRIGFE